MSSYPCRVRIPLKRGSKVSRLYMIFTDRIIDDAERKEIENMPVEEFKQFMNERDWTYKEINP